MVQFYLLLVKNVHVFKRYCTLCNVTMFVNATVTLLNLGHVSVIQKYKKFKKTTKKCLQIFFYSNFPLSRIV
jgi:hypothetical protein